MLVAGGFDRGSMYFQVGAGCHARLLHLLSINFSNSLAREILTYRRIIHRFSAGAGFPVYDFLFVILIPRQTNCVCHDWFFCFDQFMLERSITAGQN
jgi:hypothetical protein